MFESFGFENLTAPQAVVWFGLALGLIFGALAQVTRFCLRRGLVGERAERRPALGVWLAALATAILGTQASVLFGWISFEDHRFLTGDIPVLTIVVGGLLFGAGMVLTRGCVSRLTVLLGSGNLRALTVLLVFAITAHATLKGVLASIRTSLGATTWDAGAVSLADLPGGAIFWSAILAVSALAYAVRSGANRTHLGLALAIGLLVPLGWVGTGFLLYDDFDPIAMESLSFTSPLAETLFWSVASTSIPAGFGTGLFGGVILGALVLSAIRGQFELVSFSSPRETGRYVFGGALMGVGGVLAGGCTVGAGLSGVPTLSFAALIALLAIAAGGILTDRVIRAPQPRGVFDAPQTTRAPVPAE